MPALANAVMDALKAANVKHLEMPYTPERVWQRDSKGRVSLRVLARQPAQHARQPVRERARIGGSLAVEHARLVVEQVRDVVAERLVLVAEFCQCDDALVARVDLEDRLGRRIEPAGGG